MMPVKINLPVELTIDEITIPVDSIEDIAANKLLALFGRATTRDFIDVFFLAKEHFDFSKIIGMASMKDTGLDRYWLAAAIKEVNKISNITVRLLRSLDLQEMKTFYQGSTHKIT